MPEKKLIESLCEKKGIKRIDITKIEKSKELLANKDHNVTVADNGAEAIYFLEQDHKFDVILMDVHMPVMNGVTATKVIKERKLTTAPVIGMTASVMNDERESYFEAGMDALVEKPGKFDNLKDIIKRKGLG